MADSEKARANQLRAGDMILVSRDSSGKLQAAKGKTGSEVAKLTAAPDKTESPEPGRRSGYRLVTSKGVITFVTAVQGIMLASAVDQQRQGRRDADSAAARADSQGTLAGLVMSDDDRATAVSPVAPKPVAPKQPRKVVEPTRAPVAQPVAAPATNGVITGTSSREMVDNYRQQARASTTPKAKDFWNRKADLALKSLAT